MLGPRFKDTHYVLATYQTVLWLYVFIFLLPDVERDLIRFCGLL